MTDHKTIAAAEVHVPGYLQSSDPGAVGAGKAWIDTTSGTGLWVLKVRNAANTGWETVGTGGGGGGAPTTADYLTGTAQAGLSAEIVVGATPGGELGGTWASPTVDTTHSGSSHAATQSAAESTAAGALTTHAAAADPHTGYRLESADHSHASTGLQAGAVAHSALTGLTTGDPHTQYQQESEKAAANGYASLDAGTKVPIAQLPTGTSGTTVALGDAVASHEGTPDPHGQYQRETEKGAASGYASLDSGVLVPVAQLGSGTPTGSKFLRDDRTWQVPAGGGGSLTDHTHAVTGSGATGGGAALAPTELIVPFSTAPAQTAEGSVVWDSDDELLTVGTGSTRELILPFTTAAPVTQAFGDTAAQGAGGRGPRYDHRHGMPANPVIGLVQTLIFVIDGGGGVITTGIKGDLVVDYACTITKWTALPDVSGSIAVGIWRDTYANYPPVVGDLLVTPTVSATTKAQSGAISHALVAGDILRFNVDSVTSVKRVTIALTVSRT